MSGAKGQAQSIIIVKKKKGGHGGHHGGAWKVAYADFVTAMMAFFLVMWLVSQSKDIKSAVGGYFRDPGVFDSTGGRGVLGNHDIYAVLARSGGIRNEFTFTGGVAKNEAAVRELKKLVAENYGEVVININPDSIYTGALGGAEFARRAFLVDQQRHLADRSRDRAARAVTGPAGVSKRSSIDAGRSGPGVEMSPRSSASVVTAMTPCPHIVLQPSLCMNSTPALASRVAGSVSSAPYMSTWPRGSRISDSTCTPAPCTHCTRLFSAEAEEVTMCVSTSSREPYMPVGSITWSWPSTR